jgi:hypothetical protein
VPPATAQPSRNHTVLPSVIDTPNNNDPRFTETSQTNIAASDVTKRPKKKTKPRFTATLNMENSSGPVNTTDSQPTAARPDSQTPEEDLSHEPSQPIDLESLNNIFSIDQDMIKFHLPKDKYYGPMMNYIKDNSQLPKDKNVRAKLLRNYDNYYIKDGLLYYLSKPARYAFDRSLRECLVIPADLTEQIISLAHSSPIHGCAHQGVEKTLNKLHEYKVYWDNLTSETAKFVTSCRHCIETKSKFCRAAPFQKLNYDQGVTIGSHLHADHALLPMTKDSFRYALVLVDRYSKFTMVIPARSCNALTTANLIFSEYLPLFGIPAKIITDNHQAFRSKLIYQLCSLIGIKHTFISPLNPQSNGVVESKMLTIKNSLKTFLSEQKDWPLMLKHIQMSINNSSHSSLGPDLTPNHVRFGCKLPNIVDLAILPPNISDIPVQEYCTKLITRLREINHFVKNKLNSNQDKIITHSNLKRTAKEFSVSDHVALYQPVVPTGDRKTVNQSLFKKFKTGYIISAKIDKYHYRLIETATGKAHRSLIHINRLVRSSDRPQQAYIFDVVQKPQDDILPALANLQATPLKANTEPLDLNSISRIDAKKQIDETWHVRIRFVDNPDKTLWHVYSELDAKIKSLADLMWTSLTTLKASRKVAKIKPIAYVSEVTINLNNPA